MVEHSKAEQEGPEDSQTAGCTRSARGRMRCACSVGAGEVGVGAGVHLYPLTLVDEKGHLHHCSRLQCGGLAAARLQTQG